MLPEIWGSKSIFLANTYFQLFLWTIKKTLKFEGTNHRKRRVFRWFNKIIEDEHLLHKKFFNVSKLVIFDYEFVRFNQHFTSICLQFDLQTSIFGPFFGPWCQVKLWAPMGLFLKIVNFWKIHQPSFSFVQNIL